MVEIDKCGNLAEIMLRFPWFFSIQNGPNKTYHPPYLFRSSHLSNRIFCKEGGPKPIGILLGGTKSTSPSFGGLFLLANPMTLTPSQSKIKFGKKVMLFVL
jgi:hypothetical protein